MTNKYSSVDRIYKLHELFAVDFKKSEKDSEKDSQIVYEESRMGRLTNIDSNLTA